MICPHCAKPIETRAGLTAKQREVYEFIGWFIHQHGYSPSFDEIMEDARIFSKAGVTRLLDGLEERGVITRLKDRARSISITARAA